ncbi:MAG: hypothetical protein K2N58_06085 [Treponemataceae bacterium]|nr:hypothetical protein [Treponemataceae bacterium]
MKRYWLPAAMLAFFLAVATALWIATGNAFYLFNFDYIGAAISLGFFCSSKIARMPAA